MSDALDSIPVLTPVPASSKPATPAPPVAKTPAQLDQEAEAAFDKFATLFSPATPRASPVLDVLSLPEQPQPTHPAAEVSPDSEFGSFVSVPAEQDPLSLLTPGLDLTSPMQPEVSTRPGHGRNSSQTFFAEFSKSAKDRTQTQRGLLDELLMHEDDPLYWIKDQSASASNSPSHPPDDDLLPSERPNKYMTDSLSDLDFDFFASNNPKVTPHKRSSSTSSHLRTPTRSPTATTPVSVAPPLASTSTSDDAPGFDFPSSTSPSTRAVPPRSSSYASLATLSKTSGAKWVASFLPAAPSPASTSIPNTSMFPPSPIESSSLANSLSSSLTLPPPHRDSARAGPPPRVPELTHFTPFAAAHADGVYVAPSGAPGFRGAASYDWDRGFSHALERDLGVTPPAGGGAAVPYSDFDEGDELVSGTNASAPSRESGANGQGNGHGVGRNNSVGVLLDKKTSVAINLVGRREGTVGVLTPELVALIHSHLPALLRLPRQWTLFYSLDQHGISLNTLYSRCAPPSSSRTPHAKGALVVMQDAAGVLFGAWVADGLRRSTRGAYYGGGESFLWRYLPKSGQFDVYKWTGKNDYVALCEENFISFGGGDGHYGLYLDDSLFDGSSARCPTFNNEPLCSGAEGKGGNVNFECVGLEVWGVGP
ncbi:TLD-domain-containing protein [Mycena polygramma]|nr:TLD-domain-containing protein [Mycena polygramma]